jgi:hypothetical protein
MPGRQNELEKINRFQVVEAAVVPVHDDPGTTIADSQRDSP